jgi:hypothetical protein
MATRSDIQDPEDNNAAVFADQMAMLNSARVRDQSRANALSMGAT